MTALITVHVVICIILIGIILLQPGKGDMGISFGSSSQSIFGSKGASNFLTKITTGSAVIFLFTSFLITKLRMVEQEGSVVTPDEPAAEAPLNPAATPEPAKPPEGSSEKAPEEPPAK